MVIAVAAAPATISSAPTSSHTGMPRGGRARVGAGVAVIAIAGNRKEALRASALRPREACWMRPPASRSSAFAAASSQAALNHRWAPAEVWEPRRRPDRESLELPRQRERTAIREKRVA